MKKGHDKKDSNQEERRRYKRLQKNFLLTYHDINNPDEKFEITQIKNFSMGGICFVATRILEPQTILGLELKTPFISDITRLEGKVLESIEKSKNLLYEVRIEFISISPESQFILSKLTEFFLGGENRSHE